MEKINQNIETSEVFRPKIKFGLDKEEDKKIFMDFYNKYDVCMHNELEKIIGSSSGRAVEEIVSEYFDDYYDKNQKKFEAELEDIKSKWAKVEKYFYDQVERIFNGFDWPKGNYSASGSILRRFPRYIEDKFFTFPLESERVRPNVVIAHEMLHFITYEYLEKVYGLEPSEYSDEDNKFWQFTENLNVLIENEEFWQVFVEGRRNIKPYEDCADLYKEMEEIWRDNKDLDNLIKKIFNL